MLDSEKYVLLIVGMSGAGKTTVLHTLEDCGFKVVDGLPLLMISSMISDKKVEEKSIAIGIDTFTKDFSVKVLAEIALSLNQCVGVNAKVLFLDCADKAIIRRYKETRRSHPFSKGGELAKGISEERQKLIGIEEVATNIIDTSDMTATGLRHMTEKIFCFIAAREMVITLLSFSYRVGIPQEADIVLDVRCLLNPFYDESLRNLTGLDSKVGEYIKKDKDYIQILKAIQNLLAILVPKYDLEGKAYLTIAIGCTGGQHRSVFVAEELAKWLVNKGYSTISRHREIKDEQRAEGK